MIDLLQKIIYKIRGKIHKHFGKIYNMYTYNAERHYFDLYYKHIKNHIPFSSNILDIGCQYGRFTIPLANEGHKITATDLKEKYFKFVKSNLKSSDQVEFHKEKIHETIDGHPRNYYDVILCLELLYNLTGTDEILVGLKKLLKPQGLLVTSHRTMGYYTYRYIKEKKFDSLRQILSDDHPVFNCQTPEKLKNIYKKAGLEIVTINPIAMFSGYANDPFTCILNPGKPDKKELKKLTDLENDPTLQSLFINNARYLLVIARKGD